ncbi:MAG: hybrid sensor histidine kinase/response regulator [Burkholderiaceae bacterium]
MAVIENACPSRHAPGVDPWRHDLQTDPAPAATDAAEPELQARSGARAAFGAAWWLAVAPWFIGVVAAFGLCLGYFTVDRLQHRLRDATVKFDAAMKRFERLAPLQEATVEAAVALKFDLSGAAGLQDARAAATDFERLRQRAAALRAHLALPGAPMLPQSGVFGDAMQQLGAALAEVGRDDSERTRSLARARVQQVLDLMDRLRQEAHQQQSLAAAFLGEADGVRRQARMAFSSIVALIAAVLGFAVQGAVVARRGRTAHGRLERGARHLAEVAEAERARAESAARDKARFLGMLSHELLTPLQSIWSTMDVIESRGRVDAHDAAFIRLRDSTRSLRGRIGDLVDFAKMSSGRLETRIRGFQFDKLVDAALRDVEEALASRNLDVHWEAGAELARRIYSDPARLRQIVDNLLSNAVKYTERGGIAIEARIRGDGLLRFRISDTGAGIGADEMPRLFEPFYRSPATASMAEGSGLGLAVVRSLVDLMGGTIHVDSKVGHGTSIAVEMPIAEGLPRFDDAPPCVDVRRPVLVVDDSHDARRAIADVIRELGADVDEADGGGSGLARAAQRDYQAIILDLQMPDLNGYDVAQQLRRPGGRHEKTYLILVSAYNDLDDDAIDHLFDARIDKPASRQDLMMALARAARAARAAATPPSDPIEL